MSRAVRGDRVSRARSAGAAAAVLALGALVVIGPPGRARAGSGPGYDQITGVGLTNSAITVPWTSGILDARNRPIASANADRSRVHPTSPLSFMYADFKTLKVTVSQTTNIAHQGITVSWTGGAPTIDFGNIQANFLQMMQCYGDSNAGPSPEDCEYGSNGMLPVGVTNQSIGGREGDVCTPGAVPSTTSPARGLNGDGPALGCDTLEPTVPTHIAPCPGNDCSGAQSYSIPFDPVGGQPVYGNLDTTQYFDRFNTNEVQEAVTSADGKGQQHFETLTSTESPGLGCGQPETNGKPRGCWLVIVPRGQYEPNGYKVSGFTGSGAFIESSPLSASNWAMRIQIHLSFAPTQTFCPVGTKETQTLGTQLASRAVRSWQLALNTAAKCSRIYGYTAVPEATSTQQLSTRGSGVGLAFTTIPIGSEANRGKPHGGPPPPGLPPLLYAPVAVSALGFGFNINVHTGYVGTPVKLTPLLLAKALTQVYRTDLPTYYPFLTGEPGPKWSQSNPTNFSNDPQFTALNKELQPFNASSVSLAPLITEDHSALNQQVWRWIQASGQASSWLDGKPDNADPVVVNPDYKALHLGRPPAIDSFPRAYTGCLDLGKFPGPPPKEMRKCSLDLLPYTDNYDSAAAAVLTANNPTTGEWDPFAIAPDGTNGWWDKNGAEPLGQIFMWGASDTPDLAAYGLVDARLCNDAGRHCVGPSTASLTAALNSATSDSSGLLHINPASPGNKGYPLVDVTYAAVSTRQSKAALTAYADLIAFAAGSGQKPGVAPGDLPPGYLPLPASLRAQARVVVAKLRAIVNPSPSPTPTQSPSPTPTTTQTASPSPSASPSTTGFPTSPAPGGYSGLTSPTTGPVITLPSATLAATSTPPQAVGTIRWVLLAVVLAGAVCAGGAMLLKFGRMPRWLHRMRQ